MQGQNSPKHKDLLRISLLCYRYQIDIPEERSQKTPFQFAQTKFEYEIHT